MLDRILEYFHNPLWIQHVIVIALLVLLVDGYLLPFIRRLRKQKPQQIISNQQQFNQALIKMMWNRASANFFFTLTVIMAALSIGYLITNPDVRIAVNALLAFSAVCSIEQYRRALKLKHTLRGV